MLTNLRIKKFDTVIILNPNPIRSIIAKMLRPVVCLSPIVLGHPTMVGLELVSQLGCSQEPLDFDFKITAVKLDDFIAPDSPRPWIGIHPFSAMSWRQWCGFNELIEKLKIINGSIILLGKNPQHQVKCNDVIDLVNKLSVTELLSLIRKLDILVSCDSGPMHLGFAAGTPTVALFGAVTPQFRLPLRNTDKYCAIYHGNDIGCAPVKERRPQANNTLDDINAGRSI